MKISQETLQGYILEEVLAYLVKNAGYRLITKPSQDSNELVLKGNGLVVTGRGSEHQADVLGELEWIPTFIFPVRLFIEAKFRNRKTGIQYVRNAIGILEDINQNYIKVKDEDILRQRYQYNYAIFSTSGFSKNAIDLALAHNISLVDMSSNEYNNLRQSIAEVASTLIPKSDEYEEESQEIWISRNIFVRNVRDVIRKNLETSGDSFIITDEFNYINEKLRPVIRTAKEYSELFIAMANGPFMILLKANNPQKFKEYSSIHPCHRIMITWIDSNERRNEWMIRPVDGDYKLTFKIPDLLAKWIFKKKGKSQARAVGVKEKFFSSITIYRRENGKDILYRLEYDSESTRRFID